MFHIRHDQVITEDTSFVLPNTPDMSVSLQVMMWNIEKGKSIVISGNAGSGKSYLLKEFINYIRKETEYVIRVTAPTGIAAFNIEGETIYRALGLGLCNGDMVKLWIIIQSRRQQYAKGKRKRGQQDDEPPYESTISFLTDTDILVIDEAFMLNSDFFTTLDYLSRQARNVRDKPFGGMQLVLVGDALQLGPVRPPAGRPFIFNTEAYKLLDMARIHLCHNYRQRDNAAFLDLLNAVRFGNVNADHIALLRSRIIPTTREFSTPPDVHSVHLYCRREEVDRENEKRLHRLSDPKFFFKAIFSIALKQSAKTTIMNKTELKIAQEKLDDPKFLDENFIVRDVQCCKGAQMMIRTNALYDQGFFNGSLVEVLSISPTEGIRVKSVTNGQEVTISPMLFKVPVTNTLEITLNQYPLCLAWAMTIHKSQSLTLPHITVGTRCFSPGQLYVALSRAPDINGIYLLAFDVRCIITDQTAVRFESLPNPFENEKQIS
jgi:hypothetical protein